MTTMPAPGALAMAVCVLVMCLNVGAWLLFKRSHDAPLKRKVYRIAVPTGAALVLLFILATAWPNFVVMLIAVAFMASIVWLNIRSVRFCDACGAMARNQSPFGRPGHCPDCGAPLAGSHA
ncbi:MAG TPA: hypothetical protein VII06_02385 [Chloroflexota bacterium]|jgi:hypothetical protein